jgi:DNA-binding NarL/FixJ family response regulator
MNPSARDLPQPSTPAEEDGRRPPVRVLVVDDHQTFADLLAWSLDSLPDVECIGTASSAAEALRLVVDLEPSVVVMDIQMPGTDGIAATRQLRRVSPQTAVAVVTAHHDGEWVLRAAQAGASAFIGKGGPFAEMVELIRAARPGRMVVAASVQCVNAQRAPRGADPRQELTERELEVLGYIGRGLPTKSIARVMGISVHTCRGYVKSVYLKLHVRSRIEAVNRGRELLLLVA